MNEKEEEVAKQELRKEVTENLLGMGLKGTAVEIWANLKRGLNTWQKIKKNLPTKAEFEKWIELSNTKTLDSLLKVKYPTLVGWTEEEIYKALRPYIGKHVRKFTTSSCPIEECTQVAYEGIRNALRTDAGISAFGQHAYLHIKTKIRRMSAASPMVAKPENKPSTYAVRREITAWLGGWWLEHEAFRLAKESMKRSVMSGIMDVSQFVTLAREKFPLKLKALLRKAEENLSELREHKIVVNEQSLTKSFHHKKYAIQKIGKKGVVESMVSDDILLTTFSDHIYDLIEYLNYRYRFALSRPIWFDRNQHQTIGDLVRDFAVSPTFHDTMVPLDAPMDEGFSLEQAVEPDQEWTYLREKPPSRKYVNPAMNAEQNDTQNHWRSILQEIRSRLQLSLEQETVLVYVFGLDGKEPVSGSELARNMGHYLSLMAQERGLEITQKNKKVSRQRITQYIEKVKKEITDAMFSIVFEDRGRDLGMAMQEAKLSQPEMALARAVHQEQLNLEFVIDNYTMVTGVGLPKGLDASGRRSLVKQQCADIKKKLVATCL